jgi:hypothetical protein
LIESIKNIKHDPVVLAPVRDPDIDQALIDVVKRKNHLNMVNYQIFD